MPPTYYPVCKKCNDGHLVPFFGQDGRNVYFCTNCGIKFSGYLEDPAIENKSVFRERAIYISPVEASKEDIDKQLEERVSTNINRLEQKNESEYEEELKLKFGEESEVEESEVEVSEVEVSDVVTSLDTITELSSLSEPDETLEQIEEKPADEEITENAEPEIDEPDKTHTGDNELRSYELKTGEEYEETQNEEIEIDNETDNDQKAEIEPEVPMGDERTSEEEIKSEEGNIDEATGEHEKPEYEIEDTLSEEPYIGSDSELEEPEEAESLSEDNTAPLPKGFSSEFSSEYESDSEISTPNLEQSQAEEDKEIEAQKETTKKPEKAVEPEQKKGEHIEVYKKLIEKYKSQNHN